MQDVTGMPGSGKPQQLEIIRKPSSNKIVDISLHLDSFIQIVLGTARIDDEMCLRARTGCCSELYRSSSALSNAIRQVSITCPLIAWSSPINELSCLQD
jgi:hypothetical protein